MAALSPINWKFLNFHYLTEKITYRFCIIRIIVGIGKVEFINYAHQTRLLQFFWFSPIETELKIKLLCKRGTLSDLLILKMRLTQIKWNRIDLIIPRHRIPLLAKVPTMLFWWRFRLNEYSEFTAYETVGLLKCDFLFV